MGIQVIYNKDQLKKFDSSKLTSESEEYTNSREQEVVHSYYFYDSVFVGQTDNQIDFVWFDNKNANMEGREVLDTLGIQYSRY